MGAPYQSQSASGYNSSPPPDDGSTVAANKITWATIKSKITDPLKVLADAVNSALRSALNVTPSTTSVNYSTATSDHLTTVEVGGGATISLGTAATMIAQTMGYTVTVYNKSSSANSTVGLATATDTLCGQVNGTVTLPPGASMVFTVNQAGNGYDILAAVGFAPFILTGAAGTNTATANAPANLIGLYTGLQVVWTPAATNTGAATLNITPSGGSALGAKNLFANGSAGVAGEFKLSVPQILVYDGTQFNKVGGSALSGSMVLLGSKTCSSSASASFVHTGGTGDVAFDWTAYDEYEFHFVQVVPSVASKLLQAQISEDSGSTYKSGAASYTTDCFEMYLNSSAMKNSSSTLINLIGDGTNNTQDNASDYGLNGIVRLNKPSAAIKKSLKANLDYHNSNNIVSVVTGALYSGDSNAWTGIKFFYDSGNLASGTIYAYGIKKS